MIKKLFYAGILCLLGMNVHAQELTGTVESSTGEGIPFANILVLNSTQGTTTDANGNFSISLTNGSYDLSFSSLGYASRTISITITNSDQELTITLAPSTEALSELVVTANKREEDILEAKTSVTSISASQIENTRTNDLSNLTALVPNYNYQGLGVGFQQIQSIRGVQVFSENPAVATYIDGVNNLDILANGFALTDVERIEVLRGPQGTLFGRNAMGGVVNIITKEPTNRTSGFAEVEAGNLNYQKYAAGVKAPIINNQLFLGVNALYQTRDGFWENDTTGTGTSFTNIDGETVGGESNLYGNISLKWIPNPSFSASLNVKAQQDLSDNTGFFVSQASETIAFDTPDRINLSRIGEHERNIINTSLSLTHYSEAFSISSISTYQSISLAFQDIDFPGIYHSFYDDEIGERLPPQKVYSQEFRIQSLENDAPFKYTAGIYGFSQVGYEPSTNLAFEVGTDTYAIFRNESENFGYAIFGEAGFALSDQIELTTGLRYDFEDRESTFNGFGDAIFSGDILTINRADTTVGGTFSALSPKLALSYSIDDRTKAYVSYTRGFRAGGVNAQRFAPGSGVSQTFDPEYSNNFEVGYKLVSPSNTFSLNTAAFLIYWNDLQFFNLVAPFTYARENVGDATSAGIEIESMAIPLKGLQIEAGIGINITQYEDFELRRVDFFSGIESTEVVSGNSLSNAPKHTLFLGTQYTTTVSNSLDFTIRGEIRNVGSYYTDIQNALEQPTYTLVNLRAGIDYDRFGIYVWGENITDERFLSYGAPDTSFGRSARSSAPATFGVTVKAKL